MANQPTNIASAVQAFAANDREKQLRSVFVGNIPYDTTEEHLKDIFSEVGPVVTFRLVFDRETGKPKGYGFCEYKDQETALSAMRNLNGYEINGRTIRVDNAESEKSKEELRLLQEQESRLRQNYIAPEKAPEAISQAVASLPPEQMFELMKQMQHCIQNNPNQAKDLLLQNPQLAYALLQAQVVMRIVTPETAMNMLQRPNKPVTLIPGDERSEMNQQSLLQQQQPQQQSVIPGLGSGIGVGPNPNQRSNLLTSPNALQNLASSLNTSHPPRSQGSAGPFSANMGHDNFEQRTSMGDRDMRIPPSVIRDPRNNPPDAKFDPRMRVDPQGRDSQGRDSQGRDSQGRDPQGRDPQGRDSQGRDSQGRDPQGRDSQGRDPQGRGPQAQTGSQFNPRMIPINSQTGSGGFHSNVGGDPRSMTGSGGGGGNSVRGGMGGINLSQLASQSNPSQRVGGFPNSNQVITVQDQEKAALIMQVLQLSDDQIACLPPEQRQSIMVLKDQIAKSQLI